MSCMPLYSTGHRALFYFNILIFPLLTHVESHRLYLGEDLGCFRVSI